MNEDSSSIQVEEPKESSYTNNYYRRFNVKRVKIESLDEVSRVYYSKCQQIVISRKLVDGRVYLDVRVWRSCRTKNEKNNPMFVPTSRGIMLPLDFFGAVMLPLLNEIKYPGTQSAENEKIDK